MGLPLIRNFTDDHALRHTNGVTVFNAMLSFYKKNISYSIASEVHIINVVGMPVIYLIGFLKEEYPIPDMFVAEKFHFSYDKDGPLEIRNAATDKAFLVSIMPIK